MDEKEFLIKDFLVEELEKINIEITKEQVELFLEYKDLLIEWNEKINLTAIIQPKDIVIKHFIDSLSILSEMNIQNESSIIDIGTGAGFPGIPIKILYPEVDLTLVDATNKKVIFLNEVVKILGLEKVNCVHGRAEELGNNKKYREQFDYCVSRAVANLNTLSELSIPFVKIGGTFISLKGPNASEELGNAKGAISKLGAKTIKVKEVFISEDLTRNLIIIKKIKSTPSIYPRIMGKISKDPL